MFEVYINPELENIDSSEQLEKKFLNRFYNTHHIMIEGVEGELDVDYTKDAFPDLKF